MGIGNEIPELEVEKGKDIAKKLVDEVRSLDNTRPLTLAFPGTTTMPTPPDEVETNSHGTPIFGMSAFASRSVR